MTRQAVENLSKEHGVSMRATRRGVSAIEAGQKLTAARKKRFLYSGLDAGQVSQIRNEMSKIEEKAKAKAETTAEAKSPMGDL